MSKDVRYLIVVTVDDDEDVDALAERLEEAIFNLDELPIENVRVETRG